MYKIIVLILGIVMLAIVGCTCKNDTAEQNKAIIRGSLDAMNNQQWDEMDKYFAADFKRYSQATPDIEINSLEEMKVFVKEWYVAFPDARMDLKMITAENDLVAVWGTFVGTHQAQMGPFPPTGKQIVSETFAFFRLEDGLIKESWVTWDNLAIFVQLGLMTPPMPEQIQETP